MIFLFKKKTTDKQRKEILNAIDKASQNGSCVIVGKIGNNRVISIGKSLMNRQLDEILNKTGF
jgi:predicted ribosome-associated RNA-binding protein Tma20